MTAVLILLGLCLIPLMLFVIFYGGLVLMVYAPMFFDLVDWGRVSAKIWRKSR